MIRAVGRGLRAIFLPILQIAAAAATMAALWLFAQNEQSDWSRISSFILMALPALALFVFSPRTFSIAAALAGLVYGVQWADAAKYASFYEHIHFIDLIALFEYVKAGSFVLVRQYGVEIAIGVAAALATVAAFILLRRIEAGALRRLPHYRGSRAAGAVLALAALVNVFIFADGGWFWSVRHHYVYGRMKKAGPAVPSHVLASIGDYLAIADVAEPTKSSPALQLAADRAEGPICRNCPDIVLVHLESIFDPRLSVNYAGAPPLGSLLNTKLEAINGELVTRVFGGYSMISEFNVQCGVDHRLFGIAGQFPNLFLSRSIRRCGPGYLRDNGYETATVSSVIPHIMRYGEAYASYGVSTYFPPGSKDIPTNWVEMRDGRFVDATISMLNEPSARPRFILILTVFNHGPHGKWPGIARSEEVFPGPYDLKPVEADEQFRDYMNRLNDTMTAFRRLEDYIQQSARPTMIVYYGDHHPGFPKELNADATGRHGILARYVTPYRMARNFPVTPAPPPPEAPLPIEKLFPRALEFAGVRPSPEQRKVLEIAGQCQGEQVQCDAERQAALRELLFRAGQEPERAITK